jgi:hypothetical protein
MVTRLRRGRPRDRCSIPFRSKEIFLFKASTLAVGPNQL